MKVRDYFPYIFKPEPKKRRARLSGGRFGGSRSLFQIVSKEDLATPAIINTSRKMRTKRVGALEKAVRRIPYLYGAYQIRSRIPYKKGYKIEGDDEKAVEACRKLGENSRMDFLCRYSQFSEDAYGYSGIENVFWSNGKLVPPEKAYCKQIDPKYLDYERNKDGTIKFDKKTGRPAGYVYAPKGVWATKDVVNLPPDHIAFNVVNPFGGYEPYTLTDVLYDVATYIANNNENMAQWCSTKAFPTLKVSVGTPENRATDAEFDAVESQIEDLETQNDYIIYSGIASVDEIDVGNVRDIIHINDPFIDQITSVTAIPKAVLLGTAAGTELATSRSQIAMMMDAMEDLQHQRKRVIEDQIFRPFCELHGFDDVPSIKWYPIDETAITELAKAIRFLVGMRFEQPIVSLKEVRKVLGKSIPLEQEELKWDGEPWQRIPTANPSQSESENE